MKFGASRGVKMAVAVGVVVIIGLVVNALVPSTQSDVRFYGGAAYQPPSPFSESPDVFTAVRSTTTVTRTQAIGAEGIFGTPAATSPASSTRMEIFSAQLSIEAADVQAALTQAAGISQQLDGYVAGSSASILGDREVATITIRVPRAQFYQAVAALESLGELKDKATQSDDVTEEYVDLTARRENLQKQEERLQEILDLAENVDEVLTVERELERVRGEIERLTGRISYLETNVALSTIMATFTTPIETQLPQLDWTEPFTIGVAALYAVVRGLVIFAFVAAPFILIGTPVYLVYRRMNRRQPETTPKKST